MSQSDGSSLSSNIGSFSCIFESLHPTGSVANPLGPFEIRHFHDRIVGAGFNVTNWQLCKTNAIEEGVRSFSRGEQVFFAVQLRQEKRFKRLTSIGCLT